MFKWIKRKLFPTFTEFVEDVYKDIDKIREKNREVWHYTCENGHKWKSYSSPTGSYCADVFGMEETCCPICKSKITIGNVYINGKKTQMGAMHCDFGKNKK